MANVLGLVSFRVFPSEMGGQKGVTLFYQHLAAHHRIVLACSENNETSGQQHAKTFPALHHNRKIYLNIFRVKQLSEIVKQEKIDCIIAEHSFTGWMAWWLARRNHLPFIIHSHNIEALRFRQMNRRWWKLYLAYEKWIHRQAHFSFFYQRRRPAVCHRKISFGSAEINRGYLWRGKSESYSTSRN